jgi:hypothetical protein
LPSTNLQAAQYHPHASNFGCKSFCTAIGGANHTAAATQCSDCTALGPDLTSRCIPSSELQSLLHTFEAARTCNASQCLIIALHQRRFHSCAGSHLVRQGQAEVPSGLERSCSGSASALGLWQYQAAWDLVGNPVNTPCTGLIVRTGLNRLP